MKNTLPGMRNPVAIGFLALLISGCAYYSFTGAVIPEHVHTIAVPLFEDQSQATFSDLDQELTGLLIDRFANQTRLTLAADPQEADVVLEGAIQRYLNQPAAVSGEEQATVNRVTITVFARYTDRVQQKEHFARTFTGFGEYDPLEGLDGERTAAVEALENIASDIFNAATSDW